MVLFFAMEEAGCGLLVNALLFLVGAPSWRLEERGGRGAWAFSAGTKMSREGD